MSKNDSHFFNIFSLVLGILIVTAILLFALSRSVGQNTQLTYLANDPRNVQKVAERIRSPARIAVAGNDNALLTIAPIAGAPMPVLAVPTDGISTYEAVCSVCHDAGIGGAPKSGSKELWSPRIAQGKATLYQHALLGYQGKDGVMPAKGGRADLSDELIKSAIDHMVQLAQ